MSLLEVSLVLLLLSILFSFALPRFSLLTDSPLEKEGKRLAGIIAHLQDEALLRGQEFRLRFNSGEQTLTIFTRDPQTWEFTLLEQKDNPHPLARGIRFYHFDTKVAQASRFGFTPLRFEKIFGEEFLIEIDDSGLIDPFEIELADETQRLKLSNPNLLGKLSLSAPEAL